jgi:hypothetical protein
MEAMGSPGTIHIIGLEAGLEGSLPTRTTAQAVSQRLMVYVVWIQRLSEAGYSCPRLTPDEI